MSILEIVWTLLPVLVLLSIALPSLSMLYYFSLSLSPSIIVKAVGHQWFWTYEYYDDFALANIKEKKESSSENFCNIYFQHLFDLDKINDPVHLSSPGAILNDFFSYIYKFPHMHKMFSMYQFTTLVDESNFFLFKFTECPYDFLEFYLITFTGSDLLSSIRCLDDTLDIKYDFSLLNHCLALCNIPLKEAVDSYDITTLVALELKDFSSIKLIDIINNNDNSGSCSGGQPYLSESVMKNVEDIIPGNFRLLEVDKPLYLAVDVPIRVLLNSDDVLHSWAIPSLGVKMDCVPGRLNTVEFRIARTGVFYGQCSEICGTQHGFMPICIIAVPQFLYNLVMN